MSIYPNKYKLTPEQNLFLAKKKWDEKAFRSGIVEAIASAALRKSGNLYDAEDLTRKVFLTADFN